MISNSLLHWSTWHWNSWHDFFAMGGYAFYVWGSFGLTAFGVIWEIVTLKQRHANAVRGALRQRLIQQAGQGKNSQEQSN